MQQITFFNSLSNKLEEFIPINKGKVNMYVCGPTVYDRPHIGNARSSLVYDITYRLFTHIYGKENVTYVRNITDIDDKIIDAAKKRNIKINQLTQEITDLFHDDLNYLGCLSPNLEPRATENIDEMIKIINLLLENGSAYIAGNHVYFDISKDKNYGKLAGREIEDLIAGARIEVDHNKRNPGDFVLWKPKDEDDSPDSVYDSPFGIGRPGWHIECSAMSTKFLGINFDFHGGGADLMFPHHSNEIAQTTCAYKNSSYAKYWVHNGFVTVNGEKMGKSLGNFITVKDMRDRGVDGASLRLALLSTHYRKPLDFTEKLLEDAEKNLTYFRKITEDCRETSVNKDFIAALCDDMNISEALAIMHDLAKKSHSDQLAKKELKGALDFLGINYNNKKLIIKISDEEIEKLISMREEAKKEKNYPKADEIREELKSKNVILEDTKLGTKWYRI